jgi:hypothetical protein
MSSIALSPSPNVLANDDNLVNGQTYTFQFLLGNIFSLPNTGALQADLINNAPNFITSIQVTEQSGVGLLTNYFFVQFTYEGDGSDVVSDVASSMVGAFYAGSNDNLSFVTATQGNPPVSVVAQSITSVAATTSATVASGASSVVSGVGTVATAVTSNAGGVLNSALGGVLPLLAVAAILIVILLPVISKNAKGLLPAVA